MEMQTICPWCESNIIWDEEIGPEKYCPHCDNEISGYRTMEIEASFGEDEEEKEDSYSDDEWDEDDDKGILRSTREIAANSVIQQMLEEQYEMPECVNCREYMIEVGEQTIGINAGFKAKNTPVQELPIVRPEMKVIWYACPSCHSTSNFLSLEDRKQMLDALTPQE